MSDLLNHKIEGWHVYVGDIGSYAVVYPIQPNGVPSNDLDDFIVVGDLTFFERIFGHTYEMKIKDAVMKVQKWCDNKNLSEIAAKRLSYSKEHGDI